MGISFVPLIWRDGAGPDIAPGLLKWLLQLTKLANYIYFGLNQGKICYDDVTFCSQARVTSGKQGESGYGEVRVEYRDVPCFPRCVINIHEQKITVIMLRFVYKNNPMDKLLT